MQAGFALFETPIGPCGIVWGEHGISGVQLPERNAAATRARLLRRFPGQCETSPNGEIGEARSAIIALLNGENQDFANVSLDTRDLPPLHARVY